MKLYVRIYKSKKRANWVANIVKSPREKSKALKTIVIDVSGIPKKRKGSA